MEQQLTCTDTHEALSISRNQCEGATKAKKKQQQQHANSRIDGDKTHVLQIMHGVYRFMDESIRKCVHISLYVV